ncbi:MAG: FkbM family methyltransferase [Pseudomonadota bacterium]
MSTFNAIRYALNRFVLRREFLTARANGLVFKVKTEDVVGRHIYKYGQHEPALTQWLRDNVQPADGDLLIDIGANIGWYALLFETLARGTTAEVHAFEPAPDNIALLRHNLAHNHARQVTLHEIGLSDNADGAALHLFADSNRGRHSLLPINDHQSVDVPTARLDDLLSGLGRGDHPIRALKIDIEGFELIALRGAPAALQRCELLVTEFSPHYMRQGGLEPAALLAYLSGLGFTPALLDGSGLSTTNNQDLLSADRQCDIIWRRA